MTPEHRRHRTLIPAALAALLSIGCASSNAPEVTPQAPATEVHWNGAALQENAFAPLPLGSVKARGWLQQQLRIQADGLTGNLEEIWPDVGPDSGWLGGRGESWERGPYYADGLVARRKRRRPSRYLSSGTYPYSQRPPPTNPQSRYP